MMMSVAIMPFVMIMFIMLLVAVTMIVMALIGRRGPAKTSADQMAQVERMWQTMDRMEERIANLETILMHKDPVEPEIPGIGRRR